MKASRSVALAAVVAVSVGCGVAPERDGLPAATESGFAQPQGALCPAVRPFERPATFERDQQIARGEIGLPNDPITVRQAIEESRRRVIDDDRLGVTVTDAEVLEIEKWFAFSDQLQPLRDFLDANGTISAFAKLGRDFLDPHVEVEVTTDFPVDRVAEIEALVPDLLEWEIVIVEYSRDEIFAFAADVGAELRDEPNEFGVVQRLRDLGLQPHGAGYGANQFIDVSVFDSDESRCDEQLTAVVAEAFAGFEFPPIRIRNEPPPASR